MNMKQITWKMVIRKGKEDVNGECMVYLRITREGKSSYRSMGLKVKPRDWNPEEGRVRRTHPNSVRFNIQIDKLHEDAEARFLNEKTENDSVGARMLKDALAKRKVKTLQELIDDKVNELKQRESYNSVEKYTVLKNKLFRWNGEKETPIQNITHESIMRFESYMMEKLGNKHNTVHASMKCIRFFCNEAVKYGHLDANKNPFNIYKPKREPTTIPYLTQVEVNRIASLDIEQSSTMFIHRLAFLFAIDCGGMRVSDVISLKWSNIRDGRINYRMQKTKKQLAFKLADSTLKILAFLKKPDSCGEDFVFPFLNKDIHITEYDVHLGISRNNALINKSLKRIGKLAEIGFPLHFHVSRHTFATIALSRGMRIEYVSQIMGHASIKETQRYAKVINCDIDRIWGSIGSFVDVRIA